MRSSSSAFADAHRASLREAGVAEPAWPALLAYLDLLAAWSQRVNLTGARTSPERVATLVVPVLPLVDRVAPGRLIDVGSGNGSPGLVLALLRPDLEVVLIEPRARRWAFLKEAARAAGRKVEVFRGRHDEWTGPPADTVLLRALSLPLRELLPLTRPAGLVFLIGGKPQAEAAFLEEPSPQGTRVYRRRST